MSMPIMEGGSALKALQYSVCVQNPKYRNMTVHLRFNDSRLPVNVQPSVALSCLPDAMKGSLLTYCLYVSLAERPYLEGGSPFWQGLDRRDTLLQFISNSFLAALRPVATTSHLCRAARPDRA